MQKVCCPFTDDIKPRIIQKNEIISQYVWTCTLYFVWTFIEKIKYRRIFQNHIFQILLQKPQFINFLNPGTEWKNIKISLSWQTSIHPKRCVHFPNIDNSIKKSWDRVAKLFFAFSTGCTKKMSHSDFQLKSVSEVQFYFSTGVLESKFRGRFIFNNTHSESWVPPKG